MPFKNRASGNYASPSPCINKCVSKTHIRQTRGALNTMCNTPFSKATFPSLIVCLYLYLLPRLDDTYDNVFYFSVRVSSSHVYSNQIIENDVSAKLPNITSRPPVTFSLTSWRPPPRSTVHALTPRKFVPICTEIG